MSNERPSTFTWIDAAGAIALVLITIFAVTFAVQEHNDRVLSNEINGDSLGIAGYRRPDQNVFGSPR